MIRRVKKQPVSEPMPTERLAKLSSLDLFLVVETALAKTAECFAGLSNPTIDDGWLLEEMDVQTCTALTAIRVLRTRQVVN